MEIEIAGGPSTILTAAGVMELAGARRVFDV